MWTLYVSSDLAYLCFNGQMRAMTGYRTPVEHLRVDASLHGYVRPRKRTRCNAR